VYGIDSIRVGTMETRATNQIWSINSRHANGRRNIALHVSPTSTKKSPIAVIDRMSGVVAVVKAHSTSSGRARAV